MRRIALILFVTLAVTAPAAAQVQKSFPFDRDPRLATPVAAHWKKTTLAEALREIAEATHARLVADRAIENEPLMAAATPLPARDLMVQIARLTHFSWRHYGGTAAAPGYMIYQDLAAQKEEQAEIDRALRAVIEALNDELGRYRRMAALPPAQLQQELDKADQVFSSLASGGLAAAAQADGKMQRAMQDALAAHQAASPVGGVLLALLNSLSAAQWQQLQDDEMLVYSTRPAAGENRLPSELEQRLRAAKPEFPFPKSLIHAIAPQADDALAQAEQKMQGDWGQAQDFRVTLLLNLTVAAQPVGMLRVSPEPLGGAALGPLGALSGLMISAAPKEQDEAAEDPAEREKRLSADSVLGKRAALKLPPPKPLLAAIPGLPAVGYSAGDVLPQVAEAYGVRLLGDAYMRQAIARSTPPTGDDVALFKVLDGIAGKSQRWELDDGVIRFRSRTWAHDRRAEVPEAFLRQWAAVREKQGSLSLEDMAQIALSLRDDQVESLIFATMVMPGADLSDFLPVSMGRDILRVYGRLLPWQRQTLRKGQPVPLRAVMADEQRLLLHLNRSQNRSMFSMATGAKPLRRPDELASASLTLEVKRPEPGAPARAAAAAAGPGASFASGGVAMFRILFPDGQKDEYMVPLPGQKQPTGSGTGSGS